jgi:hypothetical protein
MNPLLLEEAIGPPHAKRAIMFVYTWWLSLLQELSANPET